MAAVRGRRQKNALSARLHFGEDDGIAQGLLEGSSGIVIGKGEPEGLNIIGRLPVG